jgi:hypothetical protein
MSRRYRRQATVTIVESPGSELWFRVETASGRSFMLPHWAGIDDLWKGVNEGWAVRPRSGRLKGGERRYSVPMGDYQAYMAWKRSVATVEP